MFIQPPIEEEDQSLEGPSPPLSAGSFVQELFQAQYRWALCPIKGAVFDSFIPLRMAKWCLSSIKRADFIPTGLLSPVHIAKSRATRLIPSCVSPYRSHYHTLGEWSHAMLCVILMSCCYMFKTYYWFSGLLQFCFLLQGVIKSKHFGNYVKLKLWFGWGLFFFLPCQQAQCV